MNADWLQEAVKACRLPSRPSLQELMKVSTLHPISLEPIRKLTSRKVDRWLKSRGIENYPMPAENRRLHGCTVAVEGLGIIFYDNSEEEREQRFTLAHEIAHFVLDHYLLREQAMDDFGEGILSVLNGEREPSSEEIRAWLFNRTPVGAPVHLMERRDADDPSTDEVMRTESRADLLAFELLAPQEEALVFVQRLPRAQAWKGLAYRFDLPKIEARAYAHVLRARDPTPPPFFLDPTDGGGSGS